MSALVLILPAHLREAGNAVGAALGWWAENYTIPLSADGHEPVTHWGLSYVDGASDAVFLALLSEAGAGAVPDYLAGFPPADLYAVMGSLIVGTGAFDEVAGAHSLMRVQSEEEI